METDEKLESARRLLALAARDFAPAAFANSFGAEDMVLTDLIAREFLGIEVFTLDTGRLPEETYELMQQVRERYRVKIRCYFPQAQAIEEYVRINGVNGFYDSIAQRKACCQVRKVEPLRRALTGKNGWVTGLRREQAVTRQDLSASEYDAELGVTKLNPLLDWTDADVWSYLRSRDVPYNSLHDRGYPSIGCAPCTRAVRPGEDIRAGRWWWESAEQKECGLHRSPARAASAPQLGS